MPYNFGNDDTGRYILLMIKVLQDLDERYHVDLLLCHGGANHGHSYLRDGNLILIIIHYHYHYC